MKKFVVAYGLLFFCVLGTHTSGQTESFYAEGHITENDKTLHVEDSIATLDAEDEELKVYFYPFKLTAEDIKKVSDGPLSFIAYGKPSPDESKWQWCPFGAISIKFEEAVKDRKLETITWINYILYGLAKKNHTMNINRNGQEARNSFDTFVITSTKNWDVLELSTKGEYASFSGDSKYSWDLKARTKILAK
jgi:hypothetical protein